MIVSPLSRRVLLGLLGYDGKKSLEEPVDFHQFPLRARVMAGLFGVPLIERVDENGGKRRMASADRETQPRDRSARDLATQVVGNLSVKELEPGIGIESVISRVDNWARVRGDKMAFRFLDLSNEGDVVARELNWADFRTRTVAVGARLQEVTQPGDRVAILGPQNLEYVVALFGTLYSGRIAVPLFDPNGGHLHAVFDDCAPAAILDTTKWAESAREFLRSRPGLDKLPRVIAVDAVPNEAGAAWRPLEISSDSIAYLKYTSGSTRNPRGVQITHLNLAVSLNEVADALAVAQGDRVVSWVPYDREMGLAALLLASVAGCCTFLAPSAFVREPARWIRELSRMPDDTGGVIWMAPNLADYLAAVRSLKKDGDEPFDLSNVKAILSGRPISAAILRRLRKAFVPYGLNPATIKQSYRRDEAALFVSITPKGEEPHILHVDRDALNTGTFVEVPANWPMAVAQVGAGKVGLSEWAVIVDVESASELPDGEIGEIWISGQNVGAGYWGKPKETSDVFNNVLKSRTSPSHAEGAAENAMWVRTGDRGTFHDGELFITGRVTSVVSAELRNVDPDRYAAAAVDAVVGRERRQAAEAVLTPWNLDPVDRAVLVLAMNGWSSRAIAEFLGVTIRTVRHRLLRFRRGIAAETGESGETLLAELWHEYLG